MQIVIEIPQGLKDDFESERWTALTCAMMKDALREGTVLPKGHGRLIDESDLMPDSDYEDGIFYAVSIGMIGNTPTIIEADKAGEEE